MTKHNLVRKAINEMTQEEKRNYLFVLHTTFATANKEDYEELAPRFENIKAEIKDIFTCRELDEYEEGMEWIAANIKGFLHGEVIIGLEQHITKILSLVEGETLQEVPNFAKQ